MAILIWNDQFNVGIQSIDNQHKRLVEILNQLDEAVAVGSDHATIFGLVDDLADYAHYHFEHEEELMRQASHDVLHYVKHKAEHKEFFDKVLEEHEKVKNDPAAASGELLDYLVEWLSEHILYSDKQMAVDLIAKTGQSAAKVVKEQQSEIMRSNLFSALRESETRFKELSDNLSALIWITNAENALVFCNQFWFKTFALPKGEITRTQWLDTIHPDDRVKITEAHAQAASEVVKFQIEYRLLPSNGRVVWILETAVPRVRKNGSFAGLMGCGMDITAQKQAEAALARINQELEDQVDKRTQQLLEANKTLEIEKAHQIELNNKLIEAQGHLIQSEKLASIGQLAAGVAHEINNPLGYIYSNLSSLKKYLKDILQITDLAERIARNLPADNPESGEFTRLKQEIGLDFLKQDLEDLVDESIEGATRAKKIVQDLRDFSRVDTQECEMFNLESGIDATLNIVNNELKYKARVVKEYGGIEPCECVGAQINQVFMNLLVNAAQAIETKGDITIRTGQSTEEVWAEIADTGKGISPEHLTRIFEPFFTTKPVGKGTGLGLSVSYNIVQKHNGRLEVASEPGKGTTFRVCLPIRHVAKVSAGPT
ncbi:MAG TPA: bacteriohemerythrin [Methylococcaceae bacterium]|nr:bacteriohemerythrin [Methylococcaceae bacterium]